MRAHSRYREESADSRANESHPGCLRAHEGHQHSVSPRSALAHAWRAGTSEDHYVLSFPQLLSQGADGHELIPYADSSRASLTRASICSKIQIGTQLQMNSSKRLLMTQLVKDYLLLGEIYLSRVY